MVANCDTLTLSTQVSHLVSVHFKLSTARPMTWVKMHTSPLLDVGDCTGFDCFDIPHFQLRLIKATGYPIHRCTSCDGLDN